MKIKYFYLPRKAENKQANKKTKQKQDQKEENPYSRLTTEYVKEFHGKAGAS